MKKTVADQKMPNSTRCVAQGLSVSFALLLLLSALALSQASSPVYGAPGTALVAVNSWSHLTPGQQQALAPLMKDWDAMSAERQQKWLVFAAKFEKMTPVDQQRTLEKMSDWIKLTPQQRLAARENYIRSNKLEPDQRAQKWQEYQQLSDEEKMQLANHPEKKKLITNLPSPAESKEHKLQPLKKPNNLTAPPGTAIKPVLPLTTTPTVAASAATSAPASSAPTPQP